MKPPVKTITVAAASFLLAMPAYPASATVQDDVVAVTGSALRAQLGFNNVQVHSVSVILPWGYTTWTNGDAGGDTIMEQINGTWNVIAQAHGQLSLSALVEGIGVPADTAAALLAGSCPRVRRQVQGNSRPTTVAVRHVNKQGKRIDTIHHCPR